MVNYLNRLKEKNYMNISRDSEKAFVIKSINLTSELA
jgi:hypothetical protein